MTANQNRHSTDGHEPASESQIDYVLIYEGASLADYSETYDEHSVAAELSRGRGSVSVVDTVDGGKDPDGEIALTGTEGQLASKSAYFMRFPTPEYVSRLEPTDILTLPKLQSYPVPESVYDNLPFQVQTELSNQGYATFTGTYVQDDQRFYGIDSGWDRDLTDQDPMEFMIQVIEETGSATKAVDMALHTFEDFEAEEIAELRGVGRRAAEQSIEKGKAEITKTF